MNAHLLKLSLVAVLCLFGTHSTLAEDWTGFLGSTGQARSKASLPTKWSSKQNVVWRKELPGEGSSSPIVVGKRLVVTCYINSPSPKRQVLCLDKTSGREIWVADFPIDYQEDPARGYLTEHGYASNTPVSDGVSLFVFFGKGGVYCLDLESGRQKWRVDVGKESSNRQWGSAASLLLVDDLLIVNASEESQAIFALNKSDGKEVWRQEAGMLELAYGTVRSVQLASGKTELVIAVPSEIWALDPTNGKLNWFASTPMTGNVCPSVIVDGERVFAFGGYRSSGSVAVRAGMRADGREVTPLWESRASSYVATPLLLNNQFFWIDDRGIAMSISAKTGEQIYRSRVQELGGGRPVYASPIVANGMIYVVSRRGGTCVISPDDSFQLVSLNKISDDDTDFNATPAISDGKLFLRSNKAVYCIGH